MSLGAAPRRSRSTEVCDHHVARVQVMLVEASGFVLVGEQLCLRNNGNHKALYLMHAPAALKFKTGSRRWRQRAPICEQGQALTWLEVGSRLQLHPPGQLLSNFVPCFFPDCRYFTALSRAPFHYSINSVMVAT